ncbi:MAG: 30S ribosomal protein S5 [Patescibacteria group bacterium]
MPTPTTQTNNPAGARDNRSRGGNAGGRRPGGARGGRPERAKPEFAHKVVDVRRVTRVMAGGRRFSFSVVLVAGDKKGRVGVGIGKAGDTALAIDKAMNDAKKRMITISRTDNFSIRHEVSAKYGSSNIILKPAKGKGLVAGSSVRTVLELGGVKDVSAKILSRSKNKLNNARVTIVALKQLRKA